MIQFQLLAGVAIQLLVGGGSVTAVFAPQYQDNIKLDACDALEKAADFLVETQTVTSDGRVGWSWKVKSGALAPNVSGLAALSLLDAYGATGKDVYLDAAINYADHLVAESTHWSPKALPYKADIKLLARLSRLTGENAYEKAAKQGFEQILAVSADGASELERIWKGRKKSAPALLGYDAALGIAAAVEVGQRRWAYQLADAVLAAKSRWFLPGRSLRFTVVSAASLAKALGELDAPHYGDHIAAFRKFLARHQRPNGSWVLNETQPSAYAALALADGTPSERRSFARAVWWLKSTLLRNGSVATFNDYMPEPFVGDIISEVHAEAVSALSLACKKR